MKHYMSVYPEFICIDATYKLLDIRTPVFIIINEDGNGFSEIVAVGIIVEENQETMQWFFSKFKENNPRWTEVRSIMADIDLHERRLLKDHFPNANVLICIFHAMRIFNREISTVKLSITPFQRQTALEILQKMVYSKNSDTYNALYQILLQKCPLSIVEYFNKNWHNIKDEWTLGPNFQQSNFLNTTNNRLESLNAKIKTLVERYSTPSNVIDDFFKVIKVMNDEKDHKAAQLIYKLPVSFYEKGSPLHCYFEFLTSYAFEFVKKQYTIKNNDSKWNFDTTFESCNCGPRTSMLLPCSHIFKKREELGFNLYDESLCCERWTRRHYYSNQRLFLTDNNTVNAQDDTQTLSSHTTVKLPAKLNQHQKFNKAWMLLKSLAGLVSEEGDAKYHVKLRQLIQLKTAWENQKDVVIQEVEVNSMTDSNLLGREEGNVNPLLHGIQVENIPIILNNNELDTLTNINFQIIDYIPSEEDSELRPNNSFMATSEKNPVNNETNLTKLSREEDSIFVPIAPLHTSETNCTVAYITVNKEHLTHLSKKKDSVLS